MKLKPVHWIIIGIVVLMIISYLGRNKIKAMIARGYQNNNPGNIRKDGTTWIGEKNPSTDKDFKQFVSMPYGYRALWINLRSYVNSGFNTVQKIITRWAPSSDGNPTADYIKNVATAAGKQPTDIISFSDTATMRKIVAAISKQENGIPANMDDVDAGHNLLTI